MMTGKGACLAGALVLSAVFTFFLENRAAAIDFPGTAPGPAEMRQDGPRIVLGNKILSCEWTPDAPELKMPHIRASSASGELQDSPADPLLVVFSVLVFVPVKYVYPSRTETLWYANMASTAAWSAPATT